MTLIDSLGRSRIGAWLAWLAVVSLGALAVGRDPAAAQMVNGDAQASVLRAFGDAPTHVMRVGAIKLATACRVGGDNDRNAPPGPHPALLPFATPLPLRGGEAGCFVALPSVDFPGASVTPYAARAPPLLST